MESLSGKDAQEFFTKLKKEKGMRSEHAGKLLEGYKASLEQTMKGIEEIKLELHSNYGKKKDDLVVADKKEGKEGKGENGLALLVSKLKEESILDVEDSSIYMNKLDSIFTKFMFKQPADLKCEKGHTIRKICMNPYCEEQALMCIDADCESCESCGSKGHK